MRIKAADISKYSRKLTTQIHSMNDSFYSRNYKTGQHGKNISGQTSEYGKQLKQAQFLKIHHGITYKQLRNYYRKALNKKGNTESILIAELNSRLDINIFRVGFASSFASASQIVSHGLILVNGKKINKRSYILKGGDIISLKDSAKTIPFVIQAKNNKSFEMPQYLRNINGKDFSFEFVQSPTIETCGYPSKVDVNLVVGYFSR